MGAGAGAPAAGGGRDGADSFRRWAPPGPRVVRSSPDLGRAAAPLRQVPADIRTRYIPPRYQNYKVCHSVGHCHWHQRLISPGRYESYDANVSLRTRVTEQCMADKGYVRTKIKRCDTATTRATTLRATQVLPPVTAQSCAIRLKSGRWQIVTPGTQ